VFSITQNPIMDFLTGRPYKDAEAANRRAGEELDATGRQAYDDTQRGIGRALDQTLPAARYWEQLYGGGGVMDGPGALERLYMERQSGTSADQIRARELGAKSIGDAFAARGLNNSGAALRAIGNLNADLGASEARQMADLAAGSQQATETRLGNAFDRVNNLGQSRANQVSGLTDSGTSNLIAGKLGAINARLAGTSNRLARHRDQVGTLSSILGAAF